MNAPLEHTEIVAAGDDGIAPGELLMDVRNVSLRFGGVKAITDISFNVKKGEIRAIIGPNGAGKTSMLNVINGFYHPQEGRILLDGVPLTAMARADFRRALALQPKNISIALNTAQSLLRQGESDEALREECRQCLDAVSMIPPGDARYERYQQLRLRAFGA